jgi:Arm DNA-binding domain/Phage integrase family
MGKLTVAQVKHAKPGRYGDGRGLYLQVIGNSKTWALRYEHNKRERWMGLGSVEFVSLAQARERAFELRRQLKDRGIDPLEQRRAGMAQARLAALTGASFEELAHACVEARSPGWRSETTRADWLGSLERYAFPIIGSLPVAAIDTALVHKVLDPIWKKKPDLARRLRERVECVLEFAKVRGFRDGENPARWRGHLEFSLARPDKAKRVKHHAALRYAAAPAFMAELRARPGVAARALEFLILTAARTGEVRFARWSEFDLAERVWTIPGERMKGGKAHRVPLSDRALPARASARRRCGVPWSQQWRVHEPGRDGGPAGEAAPGCDGAWVPFDLPRLGGRDDRLPEPRSGTGLGARYRERRRGRLPARRSVRETASTDARMGGLLRFARLR